MKTAMQELIEWANNRVIMRSMISPHELLEQIKTGLEKEKEQIITAYDKGSDVNDDLKPFYGTPEQYYNQTYNQNK